MKTDIHPLAELLSRVGSASELDRVLGGLLTPKELQEMANRIRIVRMLRAGATHREISNELGVGLATVSRGARALQDGHLKELEALL